MIGTDFHLAHSFLSPPPGALHLNDLMSEAYQTFSPNGRQNEGGPPFACHSTADPTQQGFLRIYIQIPYDNTIRGSREARALQAEPSPTHAEYEALVALKTNTPMAVPNLLRYGQGKQGPERYFLAVMCSTLHGSVFAYPRIAHRSPNLLARRQSAVS